MADTYNPLRGDHPFAALWLPPIHPLYRAQIWPNITAGTPTGPGAMRLEDEYMQLVPFTPWGVPNAMPNFSHHNAPEDLLLPSVFDTWNDTYLDLRSWRSMCKFGDIIFPQTEVSLCLFLRFFLTRTLATTSKRAIGAFYFAELLFTTLFSDAEKSVSIMQDWRGMGPDGREREDAEWVEEKNAALLHRRRVLQDLDRARVKALRAADTAVLLILRERALWQQVEGGLITEEQMMDQDILQVDVPLRRGIAQVVRHAN